MSNQSRRKSQRLREQRRRSRIVATAVVGGIALLVVILAVALQSGGDEAAGPALSPLAQQGKELSVTRSCVGCHGREGEGATGPTWVGLYGSTVTLQDGSTLVADEAYLAESIVDPNAKLVAGFGRMPQDRFTDAEVRALVQYIVELSP